MARDKDKNAYWTVGIPRHSETYKRLVADAKEKGIPVPTLIALRISDVYTGHEQITPLAASGPAPEITKPDPHVVPTAEMEIDQEGTNALAALDAW